MKSKRLIVLLSILIFITVLVVINSTLFTLQTVSINWLTTKYHLEAVKDYQIVEDVRIGQNIFLIKKDNIIIFLDGLLLKKAIQTHLLILQCFWAGKQLVSVVTRWYIGICHFSTAGGASSNNA